MCCQQSKRPAKSITLNCILACGPFFRTTQDRFHNSYVFDTPCHGYSFYRKALLRYLRRNLLFHFDLLHVSRFRLDLDPLPADAPFAQSSFRTRLNKWGTHGTDKMSSSSERYTTKLQCVHRFALFGALVAFGLNMVASPWCLIFMTLILMPTFSVSDFHVSLFVIFELGSFHNWCILWR